jgi:hypothetical protein
MATEYETRHLLAARHSWGGGCVAYCTCGLTFYGADIDSADQRCWEHVVDVGVVGPESRPSRTRLDGR